MALRSAGGFSFRFPCLIREANTQANSSSASWATTASPHQPAALQVHGSIANIMASMEVIDLMARQFLAAETDFMARMATGELDTEDKRKKAPRRLRGGAF
ncbi:MAG: hypothetical protein V7774_13640, partial [Pseudorhizobium pelagicum]